MKRRLPSLTALEVFEACARYANFTRAAEELGVTQSAVSRQIAYLEDFLGIKLFERVRRRVLITTEGREYAEKIASVLRQAERATHDITSAQMGQVLHISSFATFAAKWLAPRMPLFTARHPDVCFKITALEHYHMYRSPDSGLDVAIHYGEASWPESLLDRLMYETVLLVCTPAYAATHKLEKPADLTRVTRLHQIMTDAWPDMLAELNMSDSDLAQGPMFDQYAMVIEAALNDLGVAVIPSFIIESHLEKGELIPLFNVSIRSRHAYYLVYPEAKRNCERIKDFRRWIVAEARRSEQATYI